MSVWLLACLTLALGQDTPEPAPPAEVPEALPAPAPGEDAEEDWDDAPVLRPDGQPEYIEVLVIGEQVISEARANVVRKMVDMGWKAKRKRDGRIVFRGPETWMGKATLLDSGDIDFSIPALVVPGPSQVGSSYDRGRELGDGSNYTPNTVGAQFVTPDRQKVAAVQREVMAEIRPFVSDYRSKIQQRYFSSYISEVPERLDNLWRDGVRLDGSDRIVTDPAAKRAMVLDFWATRTDTPEGRTVSRTVEIWLREVVMPTAHPVTREEAQAAEDRRTDGRRLDIFGDAQRVDGVSPE